MKLFYGYLFSKLDLIGSKSEGPIYFLQQSDYSELLVRKKTHPWQTDPALHENLNRKVVVLGTVEDKAISYQRVWPREEKAVTVIRLEDYDERSNPTLQLELADSTPFYVNKQPPQPKMETFNLALSATWRFRSIWFGECPTSQLYDFSLYFGDDLVMRWSDDKVFMQVVTPVRIVGPSTLRLPVDWQFLSDKIEHEGSYTMKAIFLASQEEISKTFDIAFAH